MELKEEVKRQWFDAVLYDSANWCNDKTKAFKEEYPEEYYYLHAFYRLRHELTKDLDRMLLCGRGVEWFTLTFDNKHDKSLISSKRKNATRFLNDIFLVYEIVEEFGEDNNRYHIHGFGVYRDGKGFRDFRLWHSRCKVETLKENALKRKIKYLTKYAVKDLPRRRRSKNLVFLVNETKHARSLIGAGFKTCGMCLFNVVLCRVAFGVYNKSSKPKTNPKA